MPPATTAFASPALIACAASITALSPDPHTLLIVIAGTVPGTPAPMAACRAGACPTPPCTTLPTMTSSSASASTPARANASFNAIAPNSGADSVDNPPRNLPIGVLAEPRMTGVVSLLLTALPSKEIGEGCPRGRRNLTDGSPTPQPESIGSSDRVRIWCNTRSMNASTGMTSCFRPAPRTRTATVHASSSRCPTTAMNGTFMSSPSRIR